MKKIHIMLLIILSTIALYSVQFEKIGNQISITGDFELQNIKTINSFNQLELNDCYNFSKVEEFEMPVYSKLVSLPEIGNYKIAQTNYEFIEINLDHPLNLCDEDQKTDFTKYELDEWIPKENILISKPVIVRGNRFTQVAVFPIQYNPKLQKIRIMKDIDISIDYDISDISNPLNKSVPSVSFNKIISKNIIGAEPPRSNSYGQYLFIAPDALIDDLQPLLRWKEKLGFKTKAAPLSVTGSTTTAIKNYLQNAYDNWESPPEFVVLVGDESGNSDFTVPTFFVDGYYTPYDASDHNYTLLDGDDYFPDIMIGRFSVHNVMELNTIMSKIINYESDPFMQTDWADTALMISFIGSDWGGFYSARETVMEVRDKLLDYEYTAVDTFISPHQNGANQINNMINNGYSFVNYRGAGSPYYWWGSYGPMYSSSDIASLNNGFKLPMITSITCGGGNYAYSGNPSCFGELWLNSGTPAQPKGAIGFIGPSELDTKTWFNNANDMGIYQGITQENLFRCGEMLLRGKMALYNNFPNAHSWGNALNSDQFYFYVYNLLGDPGLNVWTANPMEFEFEFDDDFNTGMNYLQINITGLFHNLENFVVAITNADSLVATALTDVSGIANIPVDLEAGDYEITTSRYGFIPRTEALTVVDAEILHLSDFSLSGFNSGETAMLLVSILNDNDETATNIELSLNTEAEYLQVITDTIFVDELAPDDTHSCVFEILLDAEWKDGFSPEFFLNVTSNLGENDFLIPVEISAPEFSISDFITDSGDNLLLQNNVINIEFEILNNGSIDAIATSVELYRLTQNYEINVSSSTFPEINIGENQLCEVPFQVNVGNAISGELARFKLVISDESNILQEIEYSYPIGEITEDSPTFSNYGYIAIESSDSGDFEAPEYDWIEIDPSYGGAGVFVVDDDDSDGDTQTISLPFAFKYFGLYYDEVSVCSNGWMSLGSTNQNFFRNRNIPSGVGTSAMIAPFWDDLLYGDVYAYYDSEENYFVVEWSDCKNEWSYQDEVFEVILYDPAYHPTATGDGKILFQYQEFSNTDSNFNYATVGIENETQTDGLLITFANNYPSTMHQIQDETAILFTIIEEEIVNSDDNVVELDNIVLHQNYPNPFNPSTTISYETTNLLEDTRIEIYNLKGQKVKQLVSNQLSVGKHSVTWNGTDENNLPVASSIYFYKLLVDDKEIDTKKMLLLK